MKANDVADAIENGRFQLSHVAPRALYASASLGRLAAVLVSVVSTSVGAVPAQGSAVFVLGATQAKVARARSPQSAARLRAAIVQIFDQRVASTQAVQAASVARTAAIKANRDKRAQTAPFVKAFTSVIQGMFAQSPDTLAAFGLSGPKTAKRTAAGKTAAVLKNKATRKARNTMGKNQKAKIKGTVAASDLAILETAGALGPATSADGTPPPTGVRALAPVFASTPVAMPAPVATPIAPASGIAKSAV